MTRTVELEYDFPSKSILVLHSDGLTSQWNLDKYAGLRKRHPGLIAGVLYRDFKRGRDDARSWQSGNGRRSKPHEHADHFVVWICVMNGMWCRRARELARLQRCWALTARTRSVSPLRPLKSPATRSAMRATAKLSSTAERAGSRRFASWWQMQGPGIDQSARGSRWLLQIRHRVGHGYRRNSPAHGFLRHRDCRGRYPGRPWASACLRMRP